MEKMLTTIGILLGIGLVGYMYADFLTDLKGEKETITVQADDVGEVVAEWVKGSASLEDLKDYSNQLSTQKEELDAEDGTYVGGARFSSLWGTEDWIVPLVFGMDNEDPKEEPIA